MAEETPPTTGEATPASLLTEGTGGTSEGTKPGTDGAAPTAKDGQPKLDGTGDAAALPETYAFQMPEGVELDGEAAVEFGALAKELKLPADQAQRVADIAIKMAQRQATETVKTVKGWEDASRADKEFGGEHLQANLAVAQKALDTFGSPELRTMLVTSGLGNHPEVIRMMHKVGKAISDDGFVKGGAPGTTNTETIAQRMYPNMNP